MAKLRSDLTTPFDHHQRIHLRYECVQNWRMAVMSIGLSPIVPSAAADIPVSR